MLIDLFIILLLIVKDCMTHEEEEGPYRGKSIGKINSYHHQVSGEVYAVDERTLLLISFNYDGTGDDAFFWAGDSGRPGPQGFIVPDQHGKTNVLERYYNEDVILKLPSGKLISEIRWFAIYDIGSQNTFGDVYIEENFEAPTARPIGPLLPTSAANKQITISSGPLLARDANTLIIPDFVLDSGDKELYFWTGAGPQPSSKGRKIPDERGYLEPLGRYNGTEVMLHLPGGLSLFEVDWVCVWDASGGVSMATALVPSSLNVPPALVASVPTLRPTTARLLPNCIQLHRDLQLSWEVFGDQISIELAGQIDDGEYMSFGISGSDINSTMLGGDVAIAYYDGERGHVLDYNITAIAPCVQVLGQWRGVCRDERLGHLNNNQALSASKENGITYITYRRSLKPAEAIDREFSTERAMYGLWAVGKLDHDGEPSYHRLYPRTDVILHLGAPENTNTCFPFTSYLRRPLPAWDMREISDDSVRVFSVSVGPSGGERAHRGPNPGLAFYVNGLLAPDLYVRRGLTYTFKVFGGNNPHSADLYHPLYISSEPHGGLERQPDGAPHSGILAGVQITRRGRPLPTAAGPLCLGTRSPEADRRRDDEFSSFRSFNRSLRWRCEEGATTRPATFTITPNSSWHDLVYYHSFVQSDMGGRIHVVDKLVNRHTNNINRININNANILFACRPVHLTIGISILITAYL